MTDDATIGGDSTIDPASVQAGGREGASRSLTRRRALLLLGLAVPAAGFGVWRLMQAGATGGASGTNSTPARPAGWADETHGSDAKPNYAAVFPQDRVNELKITISPADWETMQANMVELLGQPGAGGGRIPGGAGPAGKPDAGQAPRAGGRGGDMTPTNPMWVRSTVELAGKTWTNVGVRYKGNSSLTSGWNSGTKKLPLKLDFDQFEDEHPEIDNQRFHGFKQISLGNGFGDPTFLREALAYDLLADAGLVAAETAVYDVTLEYGEGPVALGVYTAVEVVDDTVIPRVFGDGKGNVYEGDGPAATLAAGTRDQIRSSFQKENNESKADWSDLESLYDVLHSSERTSNAAAWRSKLEDAFDVEVFLEWLALSAVMQHWDSYGSMSHNYYLYHDPATDKLVWISWDHNLVLGASPGGQMVAPGALPAIPQGAAKPDVQPALPGGANPGGRGGFGGRGSISLDRSEVGEDWPLIRFLLDDPIYKARYVGYLESIGRDVFVPEKLVARVQQSAAVVKPTATRSGGQSEYDAAVQSLVTTIEQRAKALADFVASQA